MKTTVHVLGPDLNNPYDYLVEITESWWWRECRKSIYSGTGTVWRNIKTGKRPGIETEVILAENLFRYKSRKNSVGGECKNTGNPCGTDTWTKGTVCDCGICVLWLINKLTLDLDETLTFLEELWDGGHTAVEEPEKLEAILRNHGRI